MPRAQFTGETALLPWVQLKSPVRVGPVTFFSLVRDEPLDLAPDIAVVSKADERRLRNLARCYRRWPDQAHVPAITVAVRDADAPLRGLTDRERLHVRRATWALAFTTVSKSYFASYDALSSDNFVVYHQNITGNATTIAVHAGRNISGPHLTRSLKMVAPPYAPDCRRAIAADRRLLELLGPWVVQNRPEHRRLWGALEQYLHAMTDSEMYDPRWRVVQLTAALQGLLRARDQVGVVRKLGPLCAPYCGEDRRETRTLKLGRSEEDGPWFLPQLWAYDVHDVRNPTAHGDALYEAPLTWEGGLRHDAIASRVLRACVREKLLETMTFDNELGPFRTRVFEMDLDDWMRDGQSTRRRRRRPSA